MDTPSASPAQPPKGIQGPVCCHCGLPVDEPDRWVVSIAGVDHQACCAGCQAIATAIHDSGLQDFYRARDLDQPMRDSNTPLQDRLQERLRAPAGSVDELAIYDAPEVQARFVRTDAGACEATLLADGLRCGACAWLLEQSLLRVPGVIGATVNQATGRAMLIWDQTQVRLSSLIRAALRFGFTLSAFDSTNREQQLREAARTEFRRLCVAAIAMMQVMMFAVPVYLAPAGELEPAHESLMRWASLALTTPAVLYSAWPILHGAWRESLRLRPGMDTPVAIGIVAAFAASVHATFTHHGEVWFDTVTMFIFLLLAARYLESKARRHALRSLDALTAAAPVSVLRLDAQKPPERVPAARLRPGDRFMVAAGEAVAADSLLEDATGEFDLALINGESQPVLMSRGERIPGGAISLDAPHTMRALATQADSALSTIARLANRAATARPEIVAITEHIARWFVGGLLAFTALAGIAWLQIQPERAFEVAVALLVVSCPCALSLATPAALAAASASALARGMVATRAGAFEAFAGVTDVVFDKTGTLTSGSPRLIGIERFSDEDEARCLAIALALEVGSTHPLARALITAAHARGVTAAGVEDHKAWQGAGVSGCIGGHDWRIGNARFALATGAEDSTVESAIVWLACEGRPVARFELSDSLRPDAVEVIAQLRQSGLALHLLSGDREGRVRATALELGIERWQAACTPEDKLAYVRQLQQHSRRVLAVGDGINDAPLLAAAHASVAVGDASALARNAASVVLLGDRLSDLTVLRRLATKTRSVIRQNLGWALAYNIVAIPCAAFGWVSPWVAALGMSLSSLFVAGNSLRLLAPSGRK